MSNIYTGITVGQFAEDVSSRHTATDLENWLKDKVTEYRKDLPGVRPDPAVAAAVRILQLGLYKELMHKDYTEEMEIHVVPQGDGFRLGYRLVSSSDPVPMLLPYESEDAIAGVMKALSYGTMSNDRGFCLNDVREILNKRDGTKVRVLAYRGTGPLSTLRTAIQDGSYDMPAIVSAADFEISGEAQLIRPACDSDGDITFSVQGGNQQPSFRTSITIHSVLVILENNQLVWSGQMFTKANNAHNVCLRLFA